VPAGFCAIKQSSQSEFGGYLSRAGVLSQFRGCGLQKRMIKQRLQYAKQQGWAWVTTDTCENVASSNSLITCGFKMFKPEFPWSFAHACYWKKFLLPTSKNEKS
jgi:predicted GNAT family acetyltransferase